MISDSDLLFLRRSVELAEQGLYSVTENPRVGCLLVKDGDVIGRGWHRRRGELHAETAALADAQRIGRDTAGATAYVSLEPCCHTGRQPPCAPALIAAGIRRVVGAMTDPDPRVAGEGYATLRAADVEVEAVELPEAAHLNRGFVRRITTGLPFVRIKLGASIDGRTAMATGESQWITGPDARADVQRYRARSCAIVTGRGTVEADDPALTVRGAEFALPPNHFPLAGEVDARPSGAGPKVASEGGTPPALEGTIRQPLRVIADTQGKTPPDAHLFATDSPVYLATGHNAPDHPKAQVLRQDGDHVDLRRLLQSLAVLGCNEVLVEAGPTLAGAFLRANLWDEAILYLAPKWLGETARPLAAMSFDRLTDAIDAKLASIEQIGFDTKIVLANESQSHRPDGTA